MNIYPRNNFDLIQNYIPYKIVQYKTNMKYYIMINVFVNNSNIFGYSLIFTIDDKFNKEYNGNEIFSFLSNIDLDGNKSILASLLEGTEDLHPGTDYFITGNNTNIIDISGINIDNELIMSNNIVDYIDLSCLKIKDIDNIDYFIFKNNISDKSLYDESELDNLNATFMNIIATYSERYDNISDTIDFVYKNVVNYYKNGQFDDATILMNSILNTTLNTTTTSSTCGCNTQSNCVSSSTASLNTGTTTVSLDDATCIEKYQAAMYQWLIKMLSDTQFYCSWMFNILSNEDNLEMPNEELLDRLIALLEEFLAAGYDLTTLAGCTKSECGCGHTKSNMNNKCGDIVSSSSNNLDNCSNYSIINNYVKVLKWIKNNEITENKNKIYIYGKQFAEIFPLLSF